MNIKLLSKIVKVIMLLVMTSVAVSSFAQNNPWKQKFKLPATNAFHIANNGNMILADFQLDMSGGIYVSTDGANSWTKTSAPDYNYNVFIENDNYIFAGGKSACIARSADSGLTWELFSYADAVEDLLGPNVEYTCCYALTFHDDKLFAGDFAGGGIVYSEDEGLTWNATDVTALSYVVDGKECVENIYNLVSYNDELYAFGVYFVFKYLPETNAWEIIRNDSNFMAVSTFYQGKLCTARSVMNNSTDVPFIETLDMSGNWGEITRPDDTYDNNIRAIHGDGDFLFVGMQQTGLYFTADAGNTWYTLNDGIPYHSGTYFTPMCIRTTDEYIFLAAYEPPFATTENSGLYRLAKSDLPIYDDVDEMDNYEYVVYDGKKLQFAGIVDDFVISDIMGLVMQAKVSDNIVDVETLANGIYIYNAVVDGERLTGKIVVR